MMEKMKASINIFIILGAAAFVAVAFYLFDIWAFSSYQSFLPIDALFLEGLLIILLGFLFLLGRGGINFWTAKAALLSAVAGALYKGDEMGPNEIIKRDRWKPEGFVRFSLVLIIAGVLMLLIYVLS
jgi:hypothetical protein